MNDELVIYEVIGIDDVGTETRPVRLVHPFSGESVDINDPAAIADWYRTIVDLELTLLRPAKKVAADALYEKMDSEGTWTLHTENGLKITGQSRAAWEHQTIVDTDALHADMMVLRSRFKPLPPGASASEALAWQAEREAWVAEFFKVSRTLTAAGKNRLERMGGQFSEAVAEHTSLVEPEKRSARKAPVITRESK